MQGERGPPPPELRATIEAIAKHVQAGYGRCRLEVPVQDGLIVLDECRRHFGSVPAGDLHTYSERELGPADWPLGELALVAAEIVPDRGRWLLELVLHDGDLREFFLHEEGATASVSRV